jgi:hypothetical protein
MSPPSSGSNTKPKGKSQIEACGKKNKFLNFENGGDMFLRNMVDV